MKINKQTITVPCSKCGKECRVTGSIRISTSNPWHLYQGSSRPWQDRSNMRLCKRHFKGFQAKLRRLIYDY